MKILKRAAALLCVAVVCAVPFGSSFKGLLVSADETAKTNQYSGDYSLPSSDITVKFHSNNQEQLDGMVPFKKSFVENEQWTKIQNGVRYDGSGAATSVSTDYLLPNINSTHKDIDFMMKMVRINFTVSTYGIGDAESILDHMNVKCLYNNAANEKCAFTAKEKYNVSETDRKNNENYYLRDVSSVQTGSQTSSVMFEMVIPSYGESFKLTFDFKDVNEKQIEISNLLYGYVDGYNTYEGLVENGNNFHITLDYDGLGKKEIIKWVRTMTTFINSLSDLTGVKNDDVYIIAGAEIFADCPNKNSGIVSSDESKVGILMPHNWDKDYIINSIKNNGIELLYLHEIGHAYTRETDNFHENFNGFLDDGNTNMRGITALRHCKELADIKVYANSNLMGSFDTAAMKLYDAKYREDSYYGTLKVYSDFISHFDDPNDGWTKLEKFFAGGGGDYTAGIGTAVNLVKGILDEKYYSKHEQQKFIYGLFYLYLAMRPNGPDDFETYLREEVGIDFLENYLAKCP